MRSRTTDTGSPWLICRNQKITFAVERSAVQGIEQIENASNHVDSDFTASQRCLSIPGLEPSGATFGLGRRIWFSGPEVGIALDVDHIHPMVSTSRVSLLPIPLRVGKTSFSALLSMEDRLIPVLDLFDLNITSAPLIVPSLKMNHWNGMGHAPRRLILIPLELQAVDTRIHMAGLLESQVLEVLDEGEICPIPGSRTDVRGVRRWRDTSVAVLDLTYLVNTSISGDSLKKCLICFHPALGEPLGLLIAGRCKSVKLPLVHQAARESVLASTPHFYSVVETDFASIGLLDPASLI